MHHSISVVAIHLFLIFAIALCVYFVQKGTCLQMNVQIFQKRIQTEWGNGWEIYTHLNGISFCKRFKAFRIYRKKGGGRYHEKEDTHTHTLIVL